ncbi:hypothetical protein D3C85_1691690 [compost metagenome]
MLAEQAGIVHVHQQAEEECREQSDAARFVHAPEGDDQQQHVRRALPQAPWQQRHQPYEQHRAPDEHPMRGTRQLVGMHIAGRAQAAPGLTG